MVTTDDTGSANNNAIGGNVISGNTADGIDIFTTGNVVQGNFIGTNAAGTLNLGNGGIGIFVEMSASDNTIGGLSGTGSNTIDFNAGDGVHVDSGAGTSTILGANNSLQTTNIVSGTLQLGIVNGISSTSAVLVSAGATLDLNNFNDAIGSLAGAGTVTLGSAELTAGDDNTSTTFSGIISGSGSLIMAGIGVPSPSQEPTPMPAARRLAAAR